MRIIDIIRQLKKQGVRVAYKKRVDGGYLITKIGRQKFSGASGNIQARQMLGIELEEARAYQLKRLNERSSKQRKTRVDKLPQELADKLKKVQRLWRKEHDSIKGTITTSNVRYYFKTYGAEKAFEALNKAEQYALGIAYEENVQVIIDRIKLDLKKRDVPEMREVAELIAQKKASFKEDWVEPVYSLLYEWEKQRNDPQNAKGKEVARKIKQIIGE